MLNEHNKGYAGAIWTPSGRQNANLRGLDSRGTPGRLALLRPNPSRSTGIQYLIHVQLLQSLLKVLWRDTWTQI